MSRTISPRKIASELNVSHVTVYAWIKSGAIKSRTIESGSRAGYEVLTEDFERFRDLRKAQSEAKKTTESDRDRSGRKWFDEYRQIFGCYPPEYSGFLKGKITIIMAKSELQRRMDLANERLMGEESSSESVKCKGAGESKV